MRLFFTSSCFHFNLSSCTKWLQEEVFLMLIVLFFADTVLVMFHLPQFYNWSFGSCSGSTVVRTANSCVNTSQAQQDTLPQFIWHFYEWDSSNIHFLWAMSRGGHCHQIPATFRCCFVRQWDEVLFPHLSSTPADRAAFVPNLSPTEEKCTTHHFFLILVGK